MKHLNLKRVVISIFLLWGLSLFSIGSGENDSFQIDDLKANPGETESGYLSVPEKDGIGILPAITTESGYLGTTDQRNNSLYHIYFSN